MLQEYCYKNTGFECVFVEHSEMCKKSWNAVSTFENLQIFSCHSLFILVAQCGEATNSSPT